MKRIPFDEICRELTRVLLSLGFEDSAAERCATIFTENSRDGVHSHGLNRFPRFVSNVRDGYVKPRARPELLNSLGALEQWDGMEGVGPLNAEIAMTRAVELSRTHGVGCVGLRNTNHWMRGGTYGLLAAEAGCIGMCWTNTIANMPPWGASEKRVGNNPMIVCVPRDDGPVLLDMAMSQFAFGKLEVLSRAGEQLPLPGGYDESGDLTTDPDAILKSCRPLPIGYWKGSGLAFALDLMASLVSGGNSTKDVTQIGVETRVSQVFIAFDIASQPGGGETNGKVDAIVEDLLAAPPLGELSGIRYPGQGMLAARKENIEKGIPVDPALWQTIRDM